jgi:hypothetical protein
LAAFASISPAGIAGRPDVDSGDLATLSLWWRQRLTLQPKPATNAKHCTKIATLVNRSVSRDPYLVPDAWNNAFWIATSIAGVVVFFELWAIALVRSKYMSTPFTQAVFQIVLGGSIVLAAGILIGRS